DHDVYFEEFSASGAAIGASLEAVDSTTAFWARPRIAHNELANNFMTAAQVGSAGSRIVRGRITASATPSAEGAQFDVSTGASGTDEINPDIGGDPVTTGPTYYMVTWEDTFAPGDHDIYARLVDPTGALQGTGPISVDFTTNDDENPSISKC